MRIGVIGCGSIGSRHARNLKALGHEVLLCDSDVSARQRLAYELDSHGGLSTPALEAVLICTPASTHAAIARELLAASYRGPLFVEKPLACSVEDCAVFRSWPHPTVQVGYNWRYNRPLEAFRVREHHPGRRLHFVCATRMTDWPGHDYAAPLLECSHEIDLAVCWDPQVTLQSLGRPGQHSFWLNLTSADSDILIDLAWDAPPDRWVTARGDSGAVTLCHPSAASIAQSYYDELRSWLWDIEHEKAPAARAGSSVEDGIAVLTIIEQAQKRLAA